MYVRYWLLPVKNFYIIWLLNGHWSNAYMDLLFGTSVVAFVILFGMFFLFYIGLFIYNLYNNFTLHTHICSCHQIPHEPLDGSVVLRTLKRVAGLGSIPGHTKVRIKMQPIASLLSPKYFSFKFKHIYCFMTILHKYFNTTIHANTYKQKCWVTSSET